MIHAKIYNVKETFNAHIACVSITMHDMTSAQKKKKKKHQKGKSMMQMKLLQT
jgi:hypothetical protein